MNDQQVFDPGDSERERMLAKIAQLQRDLGAAQEDAAQLREALAIQASISDDFRNAHAAERQARTEAEQECAEVRATVPAPEVWHNLQAQAAQLRAELTNIAKAKRFDRNRFSDAEEFASWAQSRASFTLDHNDAGSGWLSPAEAAEKDARIAVAERLLRDTLTAIDVLHPQPNILPKLRVAVEDFITTPAAAHPTETP